MRTSITILGGGIAGLLAAYVLRGHKPFLIEATSKLGGNYTAGGLKYLHATPETQQLLVELEIPFKRYKPVGGIHDGSTLKPHPEWLRSLSADERRDIQFIHWYKTRRTDVGFNDDCMNDPTGPDQMALDCDLSLLIHRLITRCQDAGVNIRVGSTVQAIGESRVELKEGMSQIATTYEVLVPTIPLPVLRTLAPWAKLPAAEAGKLGVMTLFDHHARIHPDDLDWDYMYTPKATHLSRLSYIHDKRAIQAEFPIRTFQPLDSIEDMARVVTDEARLATGRDGLDWESHPKVIPGHLMPLLDPLKWPTTWRPLGRFAEWDSRATADRVLARAQTIAASL